MFFFHSKLVNKHNPIQKYPYQNKQSYRRRWLIKLTSSRYSIPHPRPKHQHHRRPPPPHPGRARALTRSYRAWHRAWVDCTRKKPYKNLLRGVSSVAYMDRSDTKDKLGVAKVEVFLSIGSPNFCTSLVSWPWRNLTMPDPGTEPLPGA